MALATALAAMESRANEYHDTTMQQAKRIAEFERVVIEAGRQLKNMAEDCYQPGALHCSSCGLSLSVAREVLAKGLPLRRRTRTRRGLVR